MGSRALQAAVWAGLGWVGCAGPPGPRVESEVPAFPAPLAATQQHTFVEPHMGTLFRLVLETPDRATALAAAEAAFARVAEIEAAASDYDPASELSRLVAAGPGAGPVGLSDDLGFLLGRAAEIAHLSGGAFDPTVGPLVRLWRRAGRQGELPREERLAEARARTGIAGLNLGAGTAEIAVEGLELDLGGIAKGYALDEALEVLREHGVGAALIDGGGDVRVGAARGGGTDPWRVRVELGTQVFGLELVDAAVATSGDVERFALIDGLRYSHVVDPRTGRALTNRAAASVVAAEGWRADALATVACVLGGAEAVAFLAGLPGVEARVVEPGRVWDTPGFAALVSSDAPAPEPPRAPRLPQDPR